MRRLSVFIAMVLALAAGATSASAGTSQCTNGDACVWQNFTYGGSFRGMAGQGNDYNNITWEAGALSTFTITRTSVSSVRNQGVNCNLRFWSSTNQLGHAIDFQRVSSGSSYQDPNLSNGGGLGNWRSENWDNRISSHSWIGC